MQAKYGTNIVEQTVGIYEEIEHNCFVKARNKILHTYQLGTIFITKNGH